MPLVKRILTIRITGKERKETVWNFLYELAHFKNLLIIFIKKYKEIYEECILNPSILYAFVSSKSYSGKYQKEFEKICEKVIRNEELKKLVYELKSQKEKIENASFVQTIIRQVIQSFKSFLKARKTFRKNPSKFRGQSNPPKPKKFKYLINFSIEGNANTFKQITCSGLRKSRTEKFHSFWKRN